MAGSKDEAKDQKNHEGNARSVDQDSREARWPKTKVDPMHKVGEFGQIRGLRPGGTGHIYVTTSCSSSFNVVVHYRRIVPFDHGIRSLVFETGHAREEHYERQHDQKCNRGQRIGWSGNGGKQRQTSHCRQSLSSVE